MITGNTGPEQLRLEGMPTPDVITGHKHPDMQARNAFARVPFPEYFGVDPDTFLEVTDEAYRQSEPEVVESKLYRRTDLSMRSPDQSVGWIVLNGAEYNVIVNYPEALANRAQARNTQSIAALLKSQDERYATAQRAGAHELEKRIVPMENLANSYHDRIEKLRALILRIPKHWMAHSKELDMREYADAARGGMLETLQTIADVDRWSDADLRLALLGLDKRLMEGRGRQRLEEKKEDWIKLSQVVGNYTVNKKVLVRDRLLRSKFEIEHRLRKGRVQ